MRNVPAVTVDDIKQGYCDLLHAEEMHSGGPRCCDCQLAYGGEWDVIHCRVALVAEVVRDETTKKIRILWYPCILYRDYAKKMKDLVNKKPTNKKTWEKWK